MSHLNINGVDKPLDHIRLNNVRSENLWSGSHGQFVFQSGKYVATTSTERNIVWIPVEGGETYSFSISSVISGTQLHSVFSESPPADGVSYLIDGSSTFVNHGAVLQFYRTAPIGAKWMAVQIMDISNLNSDIMLNLGSTALPYYPYLITKEAWEARDKNDHLLWGRADTFTGTSSISARCYGLPVKSWEIDGNSQHSGTPAPDAPIYPEFVGERTENLLPLTVQTQTINGVTFTINPITGTVTVNGTPTLAKDTKIDLEIPKNLSGDFYMSGCPDGGSYATYDIFVWDSTAIARVRKWDGTTQSDSDFGQGNVEIKLIAGHTNTFNIRTRYGVQYNDLVFHPMIRVPSAPPDFEPYGCKLSITSPGQTRVIYLEQVQTTRRIKKAVLTGLESWLSSAGVFYTDQITDYLRTPETSCMCSHYPANPNVSQASEAVYGVSLFKTTATTSRLYICDDSLSTTDALKQYLSAQYAAGTPVTVWYVLATPETGIVNEPLCKIGTYADTLTSDQAGITIPTTDGSTTLSVDTALAPSRFEVKVHAKPIHYGFRIDKSISDPSNAVVYTHDAVTMTPAGMDFTNGVFDYGSWENVWFIKNARPVMLNFDGTEAYDLDPNDYSKKLDGTPSDIADSTKNMNAMIAFPTVWIKRTDDASYNYIEISDQQLDSDFHAYAHENASGVVKPYIYLPIYKGSLVDGKLRSISGVKPQSSTTAQQEVDAASALGIGWQIWDYTSKEMLCDLLTLISKSLNTQGKFGQGHSDGGSSAYDFLNCGTLNGKGKFFGYSATASQVKCFGMEALWGERWDRELGLILDEGIYKIKENPAYNLTGDGYTAISTSVAQSPTSNNYIKTEVSTQFGSLPTVVGGTSSTFYCDYFYQNQSGIRVTIRGGGCGSGAYAGLRCVNVNGVASFSVWSVGTSPVYK